MTGASFASAPDGARQLDLGRRVVVIRVLSFALRWDLRTVLVCSVLLLATLAATVVAVVSGAYPLTLAHLWGALTDAEGAGFARVVVFEWRLPRALAAIAFGAALGAAGAVFQSLTRNPLASPDIIGFTTGSYTGALLVIIAIGGSYLQVAAGALAGGIVTALVVYLLAWRRGIQGFRLIIVGIALSAVLASLNTWLLLTAELETAISAAAWGAGSLIATTWQQASLGTFAIALLLAALAPLLHALRQMELGVDSARSTGVRAEQVRLLSMLLGVALTATVTAAAGPIAFVALAAPQIARRLTRSPGVAVLPAVATGALLLAVADVVAQHVLPAPLPVGIVTVVLGGGYLVWLLVHEIRRRV